MSMSMFEQMRNEARVAEYAFNQGRCGRIVLDRNNMLILRVVDYGYILRHKKAQERLLWLQRAFAHSTCFGWIKDIACRQARKNSRLLRERLVSCLEKREVHLHELDMQEDEYRFRRVQDKDVPVLRSYLEQPHLFSITFLKGDDPSVMSLTYLGTYVAS